MRKAMTRVSSVATHTAYVIELLLHDSVTKAGPDIRFAAPTKIKSLASQKTSTAAVTAIIRGL